MDEHLHKHLHIKVWLPVLLVVFMMIGLGLSIVLTQKNTDSRSRAAQNPSTPIEIKNPSFEVWEKRTENWGGSISRTQEYPKDWVGRGDKTSGAHNGVFSVKNPVLTQAVKLDKGRYKLSMWQRSLKGEKDYNTHTNGYVSIESNANVSQWSHNSANKVYAKRTFSGKTEWVEHVLLFDISTQSTVYIKVGETEDLGVSIDDFVLEKIK